MRRLITVLATIVVGLALSRGGAIAQTFSSGSTGADGAFNPTANVTIPLPPSGVFNYTTVNIPAGVTVRYLRNTGNTPVTILASGDVTIAGTIDISGASGVQGSGSATLIGPGGGAGGPGGFDGGTGSNGILGVVGGTGLGPGGGGAGTVQPGSGAGAGDQNTRINPSVSSLPNHSTSCGSSRPRAFASMSATVDLPSTSRKTRLSSRESLTVLLRISRTPLAVLEKIVWGSMV